MFRMLYRYINFQSELLFPMAVWVILFAATCFSSWFGDAYVEAITINSQITTYGLIFIAFFKVRLVIIHFMELRAMPIVIRVVGELWVVGVCSGILLIYTFVHN